MIGVVLQGPPYGASCLTPQEQLMVVYNSYISAGLDVCVSSYSKFYNSSIDTFISNDDILGKLACRAGRHNNNINYKIITSLRGVNHYTNNNNIKYILVSRADLIIKNIRHHINQWISMLDNCNSYSGSPLNKKIIALGRGTAEKNPWYIADYFYFGIKSDIQLLFANTPLVPPNSRLNRRGEEYLSSAFLNWNPKGNARDYFIFYPHIAREAYSWKLNKRRPFNLTNSDAQYNF